MVPEKILTDHLVKEPLVLFMEYLGYPGWELGVIKVNWKR